MKLSVQWLEDWVKTALSPEQLAARLTMAGLEVDAVVPAAADFSGVVVGEVLSMTPHPNADRLRVCLVNVGQREPLQIVCGASNVRPGLRIPAALVGAELPGLTIKAAKLRGVDSAGMLCSAKELGLAEMASGLLELPADAPVGEDIRNYLALNDYVIEVDLTPNRGDCLSVAGLARELSALCNAPLMPQAVSAVPPTSDTVFPVVVNASADCPRYLGRVISGIRDDAETPMWMQERLRRAGLRSLGAVVDVTNYVLLEFGQPMHAFDLASLAGRVEVRRARGGETLALLNDQTVTLRDDTLVIADANGPVALAGVMGGTRTAVSTATKDVFLEAAFFAQLSIAGKARSYGLTTDSSHRFERGVDFANTRVVMERATQLLLDIVGGQAGPIIEIASNSDLPARNPITLRHARVTRLLGVELPADDIVRLLSNLGCSVTADGAGWSVVAPTYRFDMNVEVDLIEEIARVHGYDQLPVRHYKADHIMPPIAEAKVTAPSLRALLVDRGYNEAITYSFVDPDTERAIGAIGEPIALANPLSRELSVMRSTLWSGLLTAVRHNINRQQSRVRLFELGRAYYRQDGDIVQMPMVAGVIVGSLHSEQWGEPSRTVDFYDLKGDVEALIHASGADSDFSFERGEHRALHPGQTARVMRAGQGIGYVGKIRPELAKLLDVPDDTFLFELQKDVLSSGVMPKYSAISKFPSIRRDLALLVANDVEANSLLNEISAVAGAHLQNVGLFDIYSGAGLPEGCKSVALRIVLQDRERTLADADVESVVSRVLDHLKTKFGATLRE